MITFPIQVQVVPQLNNIPPYHYNWTVTSPSTTITPTINPVSGVLDPSVNLTVSGLVEAVDEASITNSSFTLTVKDSSDVECFRSTIFNLTNPCSQMTIQPITKSGELTFNTIATGGNNPYTYNWDFDQEIFEIVSQINEQLTLKIKDGVTDLPSFFTITASAEDEYGCVRTTSRPFIFPKPFVFDFSVNAACNADGTSVVSHACIFPVVQAGTTIDWDSFNLELPSSEWNYTLHNTSCIGTGREVSINISSTVAPGTYTLDFTLSTISGISSEPATITIVVPECQPSLSTISLIGTSSYTLDCSAVPGEDFVIELDSLISSTGTVDWSSFQFIVNNSPVVTNPITTQLSGGQALYDSVNHTITYTVPNVNGTDTIKWLLCNTDGACTPTACSVIITECNEPPVTVDDNYCVNCGDTINLDVTSNDTINGLIQSISLNTVPATGTATVLSDNTINYVASTEPNSILDSFQYYITNHNGLQSNISTAIINIACAGNETSANICADNLDRTPYDDINGTPAVNGTWSFISGPNPNPPAPGTYDGNIDFTGFADGSYTYRYTVTNGACVDTAHIIYNVGSQTTVLNDVAANATFLGAINSTTVTETPILTGQNNSTQCPGQLVTLSATPLPAGLWPGGPSLINGDLWYSVICTPDNEIVNGQVVLDIPSTGGLAGGNASGMLIALYTDPFPVVPDLLGGGSMFEQGSDFVYPFYEEGILTTSRTYYIRISSAAADGPGEFSIRVKQL